MAAIKCVLLLLVVLALPLVHADDGTATYYTPPYMPSACDGYKPEGTMIAAASEDLYANGAACGRFYKVTCTGYVYDNDKHPCKHTSVVVKIVDLCPNPVCDGTLDLSQEAFKHIANIDANKIKIKYEQL